MSIQHIKFESIRQDGGAQARAAMDAIAIEEYALAMAEGANFPPVIVFREGEIHWLGDGFHRTTAHFKAFGFAPIAADVREGGLREARLFAIGANVDHGIRRTIADKRMAVSLLLQDAEWCRWSNREIARRCSVSDPFVMKVRNEMSAINKWGGGQGANVSTTELNNHISKQELFQEMEREATENVCAFPDDFEHRKPSPEDINQQRPKAAPKPEVDDRDARIAELQRLVAEKDEEIEDLRERLADTGALLKSAQEDIESRDRILDAEDLHAAYRKEVASVVELSRVTQSRNNGLMTENADLAGRLKSALRKIERLEKKEKAPIVEEVAS